METLANLESFLLSAESGSFSAAARRLSLTPAAVSRNVALLERNLGVRLFARSTRGITLNQAGEQFRHAVQGGIDSIQQAIAEISGNAAQPSGILKLNAPPGFGIDYLLPLMPAKTRAFIDFVTEAFRVQELARAWSASSSTRRAPQRSE